MRNGACVKPPRAPYQSPLRARLKEQTSVIILEAVAEILRTADLTAVSIAEVARVAQLSEQTIYRHYNGRDALIRAFIEYHLNLETGGPDLKLPETIVELLLWQEGRYQDWENNLRIASEAYLSAIGRELRQPLYEIGFRNILKMLANEHPNLSEETRRRIATAMLSLMSTENFVFLHRTFGFGAAQASASIRTSIEAMLNGAQ